MKDIEQLLKQHTPKPSRQLTGTFTPSVLKAIVAPLPRTGLPGLWDRLRSLLSTRAGILSIAGILVIGGTTAAITVWPAPTVKQIPLAVTHTPSGNHIVGYDAENCNYFSTLDGNAPQYSSEKIYYEIRKGSKLTDQALQSALVGLCEENASNNAISVIIKQLPSKLPPDGFSSEALTVNAITPQSITVSLDPHYNRKLIQVHDNLTYSRFSNNLPVYDESSKASYATIKPGDTVKMVMVPDTNAASSARSYSQPENNPAAITVVAIDKIPPLTADPTLFYTLVATDIVRLDPCTTSPTGFCRAYDFASPYGN